MTLCIAAHCQEAGSARIALCFDRKGSSDSGSAETLFKFVHVSDQLRALIAGTAAEARELADIYKEYLASVGPLPSASTSLLLEHLRGPAKVYRRRKNAAHIAGRLGISLEEFEKHRQGTKLRYEIDAMECKAWLLLTGFVQCKPVMFQYANWDVASCENYGAIGEGSFAAIPLLQYRNQADYDTLSSTLYKLYEAKKVAEVFDSVGSQTSMIVLAPDPENENHVFQSVVSQDGLAFLAKRFEEYGPKTVGAMHDFPTKELHLAG